jgi:F-type H+-transporting ATPase subunit b
MDIISSLQSIGFDWQVAVAHVVNFLLVLWLLNRFVFGPLKSKLKQRREEIESGVAEAREAEKKLQKAKERKKAILENAQNQRQEILAKAREHAESIKENARTEANQVAETIVADTRKEMKKERAQMEDEFREYAGDLVVDVAEKLLDREVTKSDHKKLIKQAVTELGHD